LLLLLVPCALLYVIGVQAGRSADGVQPWQAVLLVTAVLLAPLALFQLLDTLGGDAGEPLHQVWIFLATAGLAGYAAFGLGASYQALLASLALVLAWIAFADKVLDEPSLGTVRALLLVAAAALVGGALVLRARRLPQAPEMITAGGIAAVLAGLLGAFETLALLTGRIFGGAFDGEPDSPIWNVVLLVVSLALVGYGARAAARGPAYVGAVGLGAFALLIGLEVSGLIEDQAEQKLVGWPLLLLLGGGAALAAGLVLGSGGRSGKGDLEPADRSEVHARPVAGDNVRGGGERAGDDAVPRVE